MEEPDTTEKIEQTETGYRLTIKSKRGTGTRDQDEVSLTGKAETLAELLAESPTMRQSVIKELNQLRENQLDSEGSE